MRPIELLVLYLLVGAAVSVAHVRTERPGALLALPMWPLFLPGLLAGLAPAPVGAGRIERAMDNLRRALASWPEAPAECEAALASAGRGLDALTLRVAQLDQVIAGLDRGQPHPSSVAQLVALRQDASERLERGLASLDELATRVHVARFTGGAEAGDVAEQLARLAAAVDSAGEVAALGRGRP